MAGPDPAIQCLRHDFVAELDCRVKPGNDGIEAATVIEFDRRYRTE